MLFMQYFIVVLLICSMIGQAGQPAVAVPLSAPFSEDHITINGFLDDWGGLPVFRATFFSDTAQNRPAGFNNEVTVASRWDDRYLYFAFFVKDRHLNANTYSDLDNVRQDDAIELFLDTRSDSGRRMNDNDYQLVAGLHNNVNEMRGFSEMHAQVPRIAIRHLNYAVYVRPLGTLNDNRDLDSGYVVEMGIEWKSLGINPRLQKRVRIDLGNIDLDGNDFTDKATWQAPNYSEAMLADRAFNRSPDLWAVLTLNPPPLKNDAGADGSENVSWYQKGFWQGLILFLLASCALVLAVYYRRIRRLQQEFKNQILTRLSQYVQEHFKEKISLEDFCRLHNYPEIRVQKVFREHYKTTFTNVVLQKRMEEAKRLLESTDKNVTEVCFEVGFNDASYFTKTFKSYYNVLPKDVRKNRPV